MTGFRRRERFERLFEEHFRAVLAYALRRASTGDADDVVAETFLIAWRRLDEVPGEAKPWLLGVARRVVANQRRAAGRRTALRERVAHQPGDGGELETPPIVQALGRLSEGDREVVLLCAWEGLSIEEAATALGCSPTAAKVRLHRARRRLRAELDRLERVPSWPRTRTLEECREE